ncbi:MAG: phosphoribosylformylglycinamidine synthase subunit PurL, partial [Rhodospirillales bacterium]|nr:phosphoribosylformylglycinamidine synthase subunit PurL [Rhodospirillales bacterium]
IGKPVVYVGSKTGRDGIHGATMASTEFTDDSEEKRPTVQVGDPFTEKLLIEACLELMATDAIVAIQDMGAAGLTSSSFEMASKGGVGIEMDLDAVPQREANMTPYEMMLSESQERMLMVLEPGKEDIARAVFEKWELDFAIVGKLTDTGRMVLKHKGEIVGDLPIDPLALASPEYDRPWVPTPKQNPVMATDLKSPDNILGVLKDMLGGAHLSSRRWIWEQYDHMVMADTVGRPGGDAAMVRVHGTSKGVAATSDCTPRYCLADPVEGGRQVVAETWRNITATGATPLAITDNMNFGNPQRPEIMGQFVGCIEGMREACLALDYPVVSGNVSLYNETNGKGIMPTPTIGGVGLIADIEKAATIAFKAEGRDIVVIGETAGHMGASIYLREIEGREEGAPPPVDLTVERRNGDFVRNLILEGRVDACHDASDGGLLVSVAEMAMASGIGAELAPATNLPLHGWAFAEDQARYVLSTDNADAVLSAAAKAGIPATAIGKTGGSVLSVAGEGSIAVADLRTAHEAWMPRYMSAPDTNE